MNSKVEQTETGIFKNPREKKYEVKKKNQSWINNNDKSEETI